MWTMNIVSYLKPVITGRKFLYNLIVMLLFAMAVFLPDFVIKAVGNIPVQMEWQFLGGILLFGFLLSFAGRVAGLFYILIILLMQLIQVNYTVYFGGPVEAGNLMNIVREAEDVFDVSYLRNTWYVTPLLLLLFGTLGYMFWKLPAIKVRWIWLVLLVLASHHPYRAYSLTKGVWYFQPSVTRPTLRNSVSTFSYFFFRYLPQGYQTLSVAYRPYSVEPRPSDTENILLIFGESLYSGHIQMYGYERETFPKTESIIKSDENWRIFQGISGGIATATSTMFFFNDVREPANAAEIKAKTANLFRLAKQAGFKTYYISNQESRLTMSFGAQNLDHIITNDMKPLFFKKYQDEGLAKLLEDTDMSQGKNFIVLHMRSPHSPFEKRYKGREAEFEKFTPAADSEDYHTYYTNTYDNALLYTDLAISQMIRTFEQKVAGSKYSIYVTADHGELFNYDGRYGHNNLVLEQGKVPFFVKQYQPMDIPPVVSHYQIGKIIAADLGFEVINPNEKDNIYYIHGNNTDFPYDFIEYKIDGADAVTIEKKNSADLTSSKHP
ncbi:MAG: sulfatase-like hydrolase/transferase [Alphaproteobacteria bacterium]